jgi:hypothetical protein
VRDASQYEVRIAGRREIDEDNTLTEASANAHAHFPGESRFAHTGRSSQCDEPGVAEQQSLDRLQLRGTV